MKGPSRRVLALGVFDLFHIGHLRYLQQASRSGSHLIVGVTPDEVVSKVKGKWPVMPEQQRLTVVRGMAGVAEAHLQPCSTEHGREAVEWITAWNIDHIVAGGCWAGSARWARLVPALASHGISVSFAQHTPGISSTQRMAAIRTQASLNPAVSMDENTSARPVVLRQEAGGNELAVGVFDLLHGGHMGFVQRSRPHNKPLIAGLVSDAAYMAETGRRSLMPESQRLELVRGISGVSHACLIPDDEIEAWDIARWRESLALTLATCHGEWQMTSHWERFVIRLTGL